jgi:hypothetical protein
MEMKRIGKRTAVLLAVAAAGVIAAVGAYAYWTTTGTGQGSATTGTDTKWAVTTDAATVANSLTPGGPSQTVAYHVKNNNSGVQSLSKVNVQVATSSNADPSSTPGVWSSQGTLSKPACNKDDFELSVDGTTWAPAGTAIDDTELAGEVPSGATVDGTFKIRMINRSDAVPGDGSGNQDNCKSVSVPLFLDAS